MTAVRSGFRLERDADARSHGHLPGERDDTLGGVDVPAGRGTADPAGDPAA